MGLFDNVLDSVAKATGRRRKGSYGLDLTVNGAPIDNSRSRRFIENVMSRPIAPEESEESLPESPVLERSNVSVVDNSPPAYLDPSSDHQPVFGFASDTDDLDMAGLFASTLGVTPDEDEHVLVDTALDEHEQSNGVRNEMPLGVAFEDSVAEELEDTFSFYGGEIFKGLQLPEECLLSEIDDEELAQLDIVAVFPTSIVVIGCVDWNGVVDAYDDIDGEWSMQSPLGEEQGSYNPIHQNYDNIMALCRYLDLDADHVFSAVVFSSKTKLKNIPESDNHTFVGQFTGLQKFLINLVCTDTMQVPHLDLAKVKLRMLQRRSG